MNAISIKQLKDEVFNKHLLLDTYVKHNKYEFPSGKAVFDVNRGMVIRQVSFNYNLITNEDLVKWLKSSGLKVKFLNIYKTKSLDTIYIEGYFPTFQYYNYNKQECYLSFEISNSYSSRFLPSIYLGIYCPMIGIIKSDIRITPTSRSKILSERLNLDSAEFLFDLMSKADLNLYLVGGLAFTGVKNKLPTKLHPIADTLLPTYIESPDALYKDSSYRNTLYHTFHYLEFIARIAEAWKYTAYELSRTFQISKFTILKETYADNK